MAVESTLSHATAPNLHARFARGGIILMISAAGLCAGLALYVKALVDRCTFATAAAVASQVDEQGRLRPLAEVIELTRSLKLVTVEVRTTVASTKVFSNWRGTVQAEIVVPVRYGYGVDLEKLERDSFLLEAATQTYRLNLPRPQRLYADVDTAHPVSEQVQVSFLQFRRTGGEFFLGEARKQVADEAARQTLSPEDAERIDQQTLDQIRAAITNLMPDTKVKVNFQ